MRRSLLGGRSYKTDMFGQPLCEEGKSKKNERKIAQAEYSGKLPIHRFRAKPKSGSPF